MADRKELARRSDEETVSDVVVTPEERQQQQQQQQQPEAPGPDADAVADAGADADAKDGTKQLVGMVAESKELYAKLDEHGNRTWTETKPDDWEESAENEQTDKYAVIVRKRKARDADASRSLVIDSLVVQSPVLRRLLADVLDGYPGILTDVTRLKLDAPFECFVHRWGRFEAACADPATYAMLPAVAVGEDEGLDSQTDSETHKHVARQHAGLLHAILIDELGALMQLRRDYLKNRAVAFEHVWTLFPPGSLVMGRKYGQPVAARFVRGYFADTACGKVYALECRIVDWDGTRFGWAALQLHIASFGSCLPFADLDCYPLDFHPDAPAVTAQLVARGRRFESLAGYCYRAYRGVALWHPEARRTVRESLRSRIVVDGASWERDNWDYQLSLEPLHKPVEAGARRRQYRDGSDAESNSDLEPALSTEEEAAEDEDEADDDDDSSRPGRGSDLGSDADDANGDMGRPHRQRRQPPMARGYALHNKRWMEFFVDSVSDAAFDAQAFPSLVLPADKMELVLAFAESQTRRGVPAGFDDLIAGKGRGIILLLAGGPGIGKTLTAESVAEQMRVPLYAMSAGDLGSNAYDVENNLTRVLTMVARWRAVLLLDECDVFLEQRSPNDMERNRVVAIFLRTLEYYRGILFLTTNRADRIDPDFQSRIHVTLHYPALDQPARAAIWRAFLARLRAPEGAQAAHSVDEEQLLALSRLDLNGRVKNVLKAAHLLACHRRQTLAFDHLQTVLHVEGHSLLSAREAGAPSSCT